MLEIRGVSKSFAGVRALHDVSFDVARGEVHAIVGENGAGKSTLMKILSGAHTDYSGELHLDGEPLVLHSPRDAQRHGIAIIYQELNLIPELTVAENIFLGRELHNAAGLLDTAGMDRAARALLDRLVLPISTKRQVKTLRVGEQQLVEVAKALSLDARLLILDEPTSALSEAEIRHLFDVIAALKADGVTLIYISHKFDEVFEIADRITVLRDGEYIGTVPAAETDQRQLIRMMVGRPLSDLFPRTDAPIGDEVLRVEDSRWRPQAGRDPRRRTGLVHVAPRRDPRRRRADGCGPHRAARDAVRRPRPTTGARPAVPRRQASGGSPRRRRRSPPGWRSSPRTARRRA